MRSYTGTEKPSEGQLGQWERATIAYGGDRWKWTFHLPSGRLPYLLPVLFIECPEDKVCLYDMIEDPEKAAVLPNFKKKMLESRPFC